MGFSIMAALRRLPVAAAIKDLTKQAQELEKVVGALLELLGENLQAAQARYADKPCWEAKKCGRIPGGGKTAELGVCPAYPDHGFSCWGVAGTLCGGTVQGSGAEKLASCTQCDFYQELNLSGETTKRQDQDAVLPMAAEN